MLLAGKNITLDLFYNLYLVLIHTQISFNNSQTLYIITYLRDATFTLSTLFILVSNQRYRDVISGDCISCMTKRFPY